MTDTAAEKKTASAPPLPTPYALTLANLDGILAVQRKPAEEASGADAEVLAMPELQTYAIPFNRLLFWPDNHNQMDAPTFQGELESILIHDFLDPVFVRPFDEEDLAQGLVRPEDLAPGIKPEHCFEMIDGEHRSRCVATFIEHGTPPGFTVPPVLAELIRRQAIAAHIVPCNRLWAERLRLAFSELHGKKNFHKLGKLVASISAKIGPEELRVGTPWSVEAVKELLAVGTFDWEKFRGDRDKEDKAGGIVDSFVRGTVECPANNRDKLYDALSRLQAELGLRFKETKKKAGSSNKK